MHTADYLKLNSCWFEDVAEPTVPLLCEAEQVIQNIEGTEGTEGVHALLRLLPSWTSTLQPGAQGESLDDCLGLLNNAIERQSRAESENERGDTNHIAYAAKAIYKTLIENVVLYKRLDMIKALSRGLDVTGMFRLL
jgi:hypothetical protein